MAASIGTNRDTRAHPVANAQYPAIARQLAAAQ